ncbi:hypothetical protein [Rhizobacter sp. Root16D2]|uniref:hypothetical protein n=1 Tax=Rhizobacter sp. Root16D2 TaxID=1736479 RepID=UPI0006F9A5C1|nr:hypothetical protein [Rhizobacter sp. Root16D2]KRB14689.1 hypothetical protein ASE08_09715 [Rhizobacter sp. Root16D2]
MQADDTFDAPAPASPNGAQRPRHPARAPPTQLQVSNDGPPDRATPTRADTSQVAAAAQEVWQRVDGALSPVIGVRGVAALYKRSLHLARARHPWLDAAADGTHESLRETLSWQSPDIAAAAHADVLQTFCDLLNQLIGSTLTDRLLAPVRELAASGHAAQDPSP